MRPTAPTPTSHTPVTVETIGLRLTEAGMAALFGALLAQMAVVTSLNAHHELAQSWLMQILALAVGAGLGVLLGYSALVRQKARRQARTARA